MNLQQSLHRYPIDIITEICPRQLTLTSSITSRRTVSCIHVLCDLGNTDRALMGRLRPLRFRSNLGQQSAVTSSAHGIVT